MKVSIFITCLTDTFYPRTGIALVKVLEKLGCEVDFPNGQTCCGQPMFNNGYHDEAGALAKRMIEIFEKCEVVVSPSGSCTAMVRENFVELFHHDPHWGPRAKALADKTYDFVEFLVKVLKVDLQKLNVKWDGHVTYHYSCHNRGIGVTNEATQLLGQIQGVKYTPMDKMDQCCGFGGTFAIKYPSISGTMVRDKVGCIEKSGAPIVVSNDAGCTMNIAGGCRRENKNVAFKHIAEIIAEGMGLLEPELSPVNQNR